MTLMLDVQLPGWLIHVMASWMKPYRI